MNAITCDSCKCAIDPDDSYASDDAGATRGARGDHEPREAWADLHRPLPPLFDTVGESLRNWADDLRTAAKDRA